MATVDHAGNNFTMEAYTAQTTDGMDNENKMRFIQ